MSDQQCLAVVEPTQVGEARRIATRVARAAGFDETAVATIALVATELGNNLARYAQQGELLVQTLATASGRVAEVLAIDRGPGMADVQRCMQDGYSTGGTPGTGLGAVRRQSSVFDLHSIEGRGTVVMARINAERDGSPSPFAWGAVTRPKPPELVSGDCWRVADGGDEVAVMVADGLGHGPLAAEASTRAAQVFGEHAFGEPRALVERAHAALSGTRGAALAVAHVNARADVEYAGVGNISGSLASPERSAGLMSQNGTVGVQMRKVQQVQYPWPPRGLLIMHSDGVSYRWSLDAYPGLATRHPGVVAGVLWRDFSRSTDDATVVVVGRGCQEREHA